MRLLVTGGAGFIGSHLVEKTLKRGDSVMVLDDFNDFYDPAIKRGNLASLKGDLEVFEADLRDGERVRQIIQDGKFDAIVHLAARAGVRPSIQEPELYIDTNIKGTFHLLEGARQAGVQRFVFASSSSVYGASKVIPFSEDQRLSQTLSPYAATKLAGETICSNYAYLYGMRVVCLRFFTVYGPRQRPDLAIHQFTRKIDEGKPINQFGDGSTRRDYTYVDDIIQGIEGALAYEGELFDIFNLGESQTTTLTELIRMIENTVGKRALINYLPEQKGDMPRTFADISKARRLLGYAPTTPIAEGIPKFVAWYRELRKQ
ncbi:MAG TPA: GDP-mannose 4,6-dehydratase [Chthoniobacterales bacterium]